MFSTTSPVVYTPADEGPVFERRVRQALDLDQAVSLAGSQWLRSIVDDLGLSQSDYFVEGTADTLALQHLTAVIVNRVVSAMSALSFVHGNSVAGGRIDSGGIGIDPVEAIFDSNAEEGFAVYVSAPGHVDNAVASAFGTSGVIGICNGTVLATNTGEYITEGPITLEDWTAVIGSASLVPGDIYYLDKTTPGHLTNSAPEDGGESVVMIGRAQDANTLNIEISPPILLSAAVEDDDSPGPILATFDSNAVVGNVLYISGDGHVDLANAGATLTAGAIGLAAETVTSGNGGYYVTDGQISREDWTPIIGTASLDPGSLYYLDPATDGMLTATPPAVAGESIVIIGRALTSQMFDIEINPPLLLN